ncbi:MAG: hypothetical protein KC645_08470, partial [Gemmatimonadetes bacterium]|nr:hypothetical protein [Gemmatimonadota bacterium]
MNRICALCLALALGACRPVPPQIRAPHPADVVVSWNERLLEIAEAEDGFFTLKGVRTAAMMHLAMHDALNAVEPRFGTFSPVASSSTADPVAAASEAAYAVVVSQYPDRRQVLDDERARWTPADADVGNAASDLGSRVAAAVVETRNGDGWDAETAYEWHPMGPGVYAQFSEHSGTPEGFVFGAGWAAVRPFLLERGDQFRSRPPPEIRSEAYTRAFVEVKDVGAAVSTNRTA